ncbi:hypothetical protein Celal_3286 [Cellulophaga algicola DSM 14237]|uniref:DUF4280 domain-containing protein n=1 Tax=Cellulophaga algicola (strain DSM 14237 / IC166 / ACAM 630) TaxID=688270 RepID=E6X5J7_CELAD|nr:DUF4280 domain-containing protein [Cellulophaga algicola]ADV50552.1 hypothetical protein Celal_3286 [Cellulophaga algicola DSM 14237]
MGVLIQPEDGGTFEYIKDGATMICDKGSAPCQIKATKKVLTHNGVYSCSTIDKNPIVNTIDFAVCSITQKPCKGCISLLEWVDFKKDVFIEGKNALIDKTFINCAMGGKVQFLNSGQ